MSREARQTDGQDAGAGTYHDGRTSQSHAVQVSVEAAMVHVRGEAVEVVVPIDRVRLEPRLGDLPRRLDLPTAPAAWWKPAFELPEAGDRRSGPRRSAGSTSWRSAGRRRSSPRRSLVGAAVGRHHLRRAGPGPRRRGEDAAGGRAADGRPGAGGARSHRARGIGAPRGAPGRSSPHVSGAGRRWPAAPTCSSSARARRSARMRSRCRAAPWCCSTSWSPRPSDDDEIVGGARPRDRPPARAAHAATRAADLGDRRARRGRRRRRAVAVVVRGGAAGLPARRALLARPSSARPTSSGSPCSTAPASTGRTSSTS